MRYGPGNVGFKPTQSSEKLWIGYLSLPSCFALLPNNCALLILWKVQISELSHIPGIVFCCNMANFAVWIRPNTDSNNCYWKAKWCVKNIDGVFFFVRKVKCLHTPVIRGRLHELHGLIIDMVSHFFLESCPKQNRFNNFSCYSVRRTGKTELHVLGEKLEKHCSGLNIALYSGVL